MNPINSHALTSNFPRISLQFPSNSSPPPPPNKNIIKLPLKLSHPFQPDLFSQLFQGRIHQGDSLRLMSAPILGALASGRPLPSTGATGDSQLSIRAWVGGVPLAVGLYTQPGVQRLASTRRT